MKRFIGLFFLMLIAGCNAEDAPLFVEQDFTEDINGVQAIVQKEERIQQRQVVATEEIVLVTYEVKPTFRVQKQRVERELKKKLEEAYPSLTFVVSGDFKLHYEAKRLAKQNNSESDASKTDDTDEGESVDDKKKKDEKATTKNNKQSVKKVIEELKKLAEEET